MFYASMNIFPKITINPNLSILNYKTPSFRGNFAQSKDSFIRTTSKRMETIKNIRGQDITGVVVKDVVFKDRENNPVCGFLMQDINDKNQYFAAAKGENQCRMLISEEENCIFVEELYGKNNHGEIKGAGSELLKYAVEKSLILGHGGKVELQMAGSLPFYFKNNFRLSNKRYRYANIQNAAIDYITRTKTEKNKLWHADWSTPIITLTPRNAQKLLSGERISDKSKSQILYSSLIDTEKRKYEIDMDFCDLEDCFVLQMINKKAKSCAQMATLEGKIENGKLIPNGEIKSDFFYDVDKNIVKEFENALKVANETYKTKN